MQPNLAIFTVHISIIALNDQRYLACFPELAILIFRLIFPFLSMVRRLAAGLGPGIRCNKDHCKGLRKPGYAYLRTTVPEVVMGVR